MTERQRQRMERLIEALVPLASVKRNKPGAFAVARALEDRAYAAWESLVSRAGRISQSSPFLLKA